MSKKNFEMLYGFKERVTKLEAMIGYTSNDPYFLWEAIQAAGSPVIMAGSRAIINGNKKLAALGDAVADHWLWLEFYRSSCTKGQGDNRRQILFSNQNLSQVGRRLGIDSVMIKDRGLRLASDEMVATMLEAIFGAVYLDGGMDAVGKIMGNLGFDPTV